MPEKRTRRKARGRAGRRTRSVDIPPFITRQFPPTEVVSEEGLVQIEDNADLILEEIGVDFRNYPSALERLDQAGAQVKGERVRFPRGLCRELITETAPQQFTHQARNPSRSVQVGGDATVFAPAYGSPFVHDLDRGRRYATIEDFQNFVKLAYQSPHMHCSGGTVCEPVDIPVAKRHLDMVYAHLRYSDKPFMGSVTSAERASDTITMAKLVFGEDFVESHTVVTSLINASSPLTWDGSMLGVAEIYAQHMQANMISPFILSGAMAPVTVAGVAAQTLAEALAGMAFVQLVRPGAPMIFGSFSSSISMQSGAPTFGTPEAALQLYTVAALARRLGVPFRSGGNLCASKIPDAQAAAESQATLIPTLMAGTNFVLHAAGWLEGGLAMGYEKFIIDADQCGLMTHFTRGVDLSENGQAIEAIREVGPGQHFLGAAHTYQNFENAFARSEVANNDSYEQWAEEGSLDAAQRANRIWKERLAEYQAPELDPSIDQALLDFISRRKSELPDGLV